MFFELQTEFFVVVGSFLSFVVGIVFMIWSF